MATYVPGSANRIVALVAGQADATIVDLSNKNKLVRKHGSKFNVVCRCSTLMGDEALFEPELEANAKDVDIFVKALLSVYRDMAKDPTVEGKPTPRTFGQLCRKRFSLNWISTPRPWRAVCTIQTAVGKKPRWPIWNGTPKPVISPADLKIDDFWYLNRYFPGGRSGLSAG